MLTLVLVNFTPLGGLIAIVFLSSMGSLLWWMLHPPKQVSSTAAQMKYSVTAINKILVPTTGDFYSQRGVELACRLGQEQQAEMVLIYIIEVPFALTLGTPLPEEEARATDVLDIAQTIAEHHNLKCTLRIEKARNVVDKIRQIITEEEISLIVIGMRPRREELEDILGNVSERLLRNLPCEVIIDAQPLEF